MLEDITAYATLTKDRSWSVLSLYRLGICKHLSAHNMVLASAELMDPSRTFPESSFTRPELTVEYYVLRAEFRELFTEEQRWIVWERLHPARELV